ncbi:MAG: NAD-dependent epimerase/dehydratase family protein [Myxococcota bacterium]
MSEAEVSEQRDRARTILITGGAGFLGQAILRELRGRARSEVAVPAQIRVYDRRPNPGLNAPAIDYVEGDIRSYPELRRALEGVDLVIHSAALIDWGHTSAAELREVNLEGTRNVIRACQEAGVRGLVYTSTLDAIYAGDPITDGDESLPYPDRFVNAYAETKALAEQAVLAANGSDRRPRAEEPPGDPSLRTCVIRPCGMFGEADPYHMSVTLRMAEAGRLGFRIGDGKAVFQHVYVGNVAHAHLLALFQLLEPGSPLPGQVYFITDGPAVNFFDYIAPMLSRLGHTPPPPSRRLPYSLVYAMGALMEATTVLCRPFVRLRPAITRSSVKLVCHNFSFLGHKAERDLGYQPVYSQEEAFDRTVGYFKVHGPVPEHPAG